MCHADEQLWSHAIVSSDVDIDVPFFKHFTGKEEMTFVFSIQYLRQNELWAGRKRGLSRGEVNECCVGLCVDPLTSLLCVSILIAFTYSVYGPDTKMESNCIAPFKSTSLHSFTLLRCSTNCFQEIRLILCIKSSLNDWDYSTPLWKEPSLSPASTYSDDGCLFFLSIKATKAEVECMRVHPTSKGCESWRWQGSNNYTNSAKVKMK